MKPRPAGGETSGRAAKGEAGRRRREAEAGWGKPTSIQGVVLLHLTSLNRRSTAYGRNDGMGMETATDARCGTVARLRAADERPSGVGRCSTGGLATTPRPVQRHVVAHNGRPGSDMHATTHGFVSRIGPSHGGKSGAAGRCV
ncbi:hypothetical protein ACP4OV_009652 [Aristida adscensionis]